MFIVKEDGPLVYRDELNAAYERIQKLEASLRHAQEALFWHDGMKFELNGRTIEEVITESLP